MIFAFALLVIAGFFCHAAGDLPPQPNKTKWAYWHFLGWALWFVASILHFAPDLGVH